MYWTTVSVIHFWEGGLFKRVVISLAYGNEMLPTCVQHFSDIYRLTRHATKWSNNSRWLIHKVLWIQLRKVKPSDKHLSHLSVWNRIFLCDNCTQMCQFSEKKFMIILWSENFESKSQNLEMNYEKDFQDNPKLPRFPPTRFLGREARKFRIVRKILQI